MLWPAAVKLVATLIRSTVSIGPRYARPARDDDSGRYPRLRPQVSRSHLRLGMHHDLVASRRLGVVISSAHDQDLRHQELRHDEEGPRLARPEGRRLRLP